MKKLKEFVKSPLIQIALVTGICIIAMAWFSKHILTRPISYLPLAVPPFLSTIHGALYSKDKEAKICTTWYWVVAILLATIIIIVLTG